MSHRGCGIGKDVSYPHLRVFNQIGKLDPKSRLCIYLGYDKDEFSYWLWDLINKKVIRSRDIVFMEENTIADWETENMGSPS